MSGGPTGVSALSSATIVKTPVTLNASFDAWYDRTIDRVVIGVATGIGDLFVGVYSGVNGFTLLGSQTAAGVVPNSVSTGVSFDGSVYRAFAAYHAGGQVKSFTFNAITFAGPTSTVIAAPGAGLTRVSVIRAPWAVLTNYMIVFYDRAEGVVLPWQYSVSYVPTTAVGVAAGAPQILAGASVLAARPVPYFSAQGLADICVPVALLSDLQPTIYALKFGDGSAPGSLSYALLDGMSLDSPCVLARIFPGECGDIKTGLFHSNRLPTCFLTDGATTIDIPFTKAGRVIVTNGVNVTASRATLATIDFASAMQTSELQRSLFLSGACPHLYDGNQTHEAGFHYFPEYLNLTPGITGGGGMTPGATYAFCQTYEWEDARGVFHRSAVSVPVSVTLGVGDNSVTCLFNCLRLTRKQGYEALVSSEVRRHGVRVVTYRTLANGTVFYRDAQNDNTISAAGAIGSHGSTISDALLAGNALLYNTGGGLDNEAFPSVNVLCTHQRRFFMGIQDSTNLIQYTDEVDENFFAPATNEVYRIQVPPDGGAVTGLASMDDKLIIICERQIFYIFGDGPNRLGQQNGYSLPQLCSGQLGGMLGTQQSLALTPEGLWFMASDGGLRLLTRGLNIATSSADGGGFLGREADGLVASFSNIVAVEVQGRSQVRWYLSGDSRSVVVWDYAQRAWSRFTNHDSSGGATAARGLAWHSNQSQLFSSSTPGSLDSGGGVTQVIETAWIALGGIQGFQRVQSVMLLFNALHASRVTLEVGYDYVESYNPEFPNPQVELHNFDTAAGNPIQIEHKLARQKCEAVRFRITAFAGFTATVNATGGGELTFLTDLAYDGGNGGQVNPGFLLDGNSIPPALWDGTATTSPPGGHVGVQIGTPVTPGVSIIDNLAATVVAAEDVYVLAAGSPMPTVGQFFIGLSSGAQGIVSDVIHYTYPFDLYAFAATGLVGGLFTGEMVNFSSAGESVRLTGLSISVGVKKGLNRLPQSGRF